MFQSFGVPQSLPREKKNKRWALVVTVLIIAGFISIPLSVLTGLLK
jgi:hypothetical protein